MHLADRLRGARRRRDHVDGGRAGPAQVGVRKVVDALVVRVGVDRRHQARSMPNVSCSTFAIGASQFVVHDAFEMTSWLRVVACRR